MTVALTIQEKLKDLRVERRLTLEQLAIKTGLSRAALGNYETDDYKDISPFSIVTLAQFYGVSTDYLLGLTETKNHPNTELHELLLSDEMIDVLKSGKINNRLLCEMVSHEGFRRLMVDIEIYIDRIADMRINDLNSILDVVRSEIAKSHTTDENDLHLRTLELAHINEDDYFSHIIHNDIDRIIRDIREAHKKDSSTAPETTTAEKIQSSLSDAIRFQGSDQERQIRIFCKQLGIDYDKLTVEEFAVLIQILKKSELLKSPYNKRGKVSSGKGKAKNK